MTFDPEAMLAQSIAAMNSVGSLFDFASEPVEGTDEKKVVTATVEPSMQLLSVRVQPKWQEKIEPEHLNLAVRMAIGNATCKVMGFDPAGDKPAPVAPDPEHIEVTAADREQARQRIENGMKRFEGVENADHGELWEKFHSTMDQAKAIDPEPSRNPGEKQYFNESRRASMTYAEGLPVEVDFDLNWLRSRSGNAITEALTQIIDQAREDNAELAERNSHLIAGLGRNDK